MDSKIFAYIRVSTKEQNIDRQYEKMKALDIEERFIFIDKASGYTFEREQYKILRKILRPGDLLYIDSLDRLGRNYEAIITEWKYITREINADIVVLDNESLFDSRKFKEMNEIGKLMEDQFLSLLAYVAEQERTKILTRQKEGIRAAKAKGIHLGRPAINYKTLSDNQKSQLEQYFPQWLEKNITGVQFAKKLGLRKNTFYKVINQYKAILNK